MHELSSRSRRALADVQPIIVSNRGPVGWKVDESGRGQVVRSEGGGLLTAMSAVSRATDAIWVATAKDAPDRELAVRARLAPLVDDTGARYRMGFITPSERAYDLYYNVIANPLLWFVQHYLWDIANEPVVDSDTMTAWREGYVHVNELFAAEVVRQAKRSSKTPLVMLQDYHLYLAPQMIREKLPGAIIQQFIHIPWPEAGYWQTLPREMREQMLRGLLGNDIVGFQTRKDADAFRDCCRRDLGLAVGKKGVRFGGRTVRVENYPISVDIEAFETLAEDPATLREAAAVEAWRPERLIVRVDRMDLSKNIVRGFMAYATMLEQHPEMQGKVQFWAFLQTTRTDVQQYRDYAGKIDRIVADINARFGTPDWTPIVYERAQNIHRAVAAYRSFDVLLVNPVRDGMNLVVKEGMLCNRRNGVPVLSTGAGAHEELGDLALSVDAVDVQQTADALYQGLTMSDRQKQVRGEGIRDVVRRNDLSRWVERQVADIGAVIRERQVRGRDLS